MPLVDKDFEWPSLWFLMFASFSFLCFLYFDREIGLCSEMYDKIKKFKQNGRELYIFSVLV